MAATPLHTLNSYQADAISTAIYPVIGHGIVYPALKLNGEAGEIAEEVGKMFRDDKGVMDGERRRKIILELGDCLWYIAACAKELDVSLDEVATMNLDKLARRKAQGKIQGSGSDR